MSNTNLPELDARTNTNIEPQQITEALPPTTETTTSVPEQPDLESAIHTSPSQEIQEQPTSIDSSILVDIANQQTAIEPAQVELINKMSKDLGFNSVVLKDTYSEPHKQEALKSFLDYINEKDKALKSELPKANKDKIIESLTKDYLNTKASMLSKYSDKQAQDLSKLSSPIDKTELNDTFLRMKKAERNPSNEKAIKESYVDMDNILGINTSHYGDKRGAILQAETNIVNSQGFLARQGNLNKKIKIANDYKSELEKALGYTKDEGTIKTIKERIDLTNADIERWSQKTMPETSTFQNGNNSENEGGRIADAYNRLINRQNTDHTQVNLYDLFTERFPDIGKTLNSFDTKQARSDYLNQHPEELKQLHDFLLNEINKNPNNFVLNEGELGQVNSKIPKEIGIPINDKYFGYITIKDPSKLSTSTSIAEAPRRQKSYEEPYDKENAKFYSKKRTALEVANHILKTNKADKDTHTMLQALLEHPAFKKALEQITLFHDKHIGGKLYTQASRDSLNYLYEKREDIGAFYNPHEKEIITLYDSPQLLLHEMIHAATFHFIQDAPRSETAELRKIFDIAKTHAEKNGQDFYGLTNEMEFMSETFSNLQFQKFLSSIPYNEKVSLWDRFVQFISKIFNLSPDKTTLLHKALDEGYKIMTKQQERNATEPFDTATSQNQIAPMKMDESFGDIVKKIKNQEEFYTATPIEKEGVFKTVFRHIDKFFDILHPLGYQGSKEYEMLRNQMKGEFGLKAAQSKQWIDARLKAKGANGELLVPPSEYQHIIEALHPEETYNTKDSTGAEITKTTKREKDLTPEGKKLYQEIRTLTDNIGKELVDVGLISKKTYESMKDNYLRRIYLSKIIDDIQRDNSLYGHKIKEHDFNQRVLYDTQEQASIGKITQDLPLIIQMMVEKAADAVSKAKFYEKVKTANPQTGWIGQFGNELNIELPPKPIGDIQAFKNWVINNRQEIVDMKNKGDIISDGYKQRVAEDELAKEAFPQVFDSTDTLTLPSFAPNIDTEQAGKTFELKQVVYKTNNPEAFIKNINTMKTAADHAEANNDPNAAALRKRANDLQAKRTEIEQKYKVNLDDYALVSEGGYGKLSGAITLKAIKSDISPFIDTIKNRDSGSGKVLSDLLDIHRKALSLFKVSKVALSPAAYIRSITSNLMLFMGDGTSPVEAGKYLLKAMTSIKNQDDSYQSALKAGTFKGTFHSGELNEILIDTYKNTNSNPLVRLYKTVIDLSKNYSKIDEVYKYAKVLKDVDKGFSYDDAAVNAHRLFMDYSLVHPVVRQLRANIMPFGTYSYKILPILARQFTTPAGLLTLGTSLALFGVLNSMSQAYHGLSDEEMEQLKKDLPSYVRKNNSLLMLPIKNDQGNPEWMDVQYFTPYSLLLSVTQDMKEGEVGHLLSDLGIGNPILDTLFLARGIVGDTPPRDLFTGKEIYNPLDTTSNKMLKSMTYIYDKFAPTILNMSKDSAGFVPMMSKVITGNKNRWGAETTLPQTLGRQIGINIISPSKEQGTAEKKARIMTLRSYHSKAIKDPNLTDEEKADYKKRLDEKIAEIEGATD